MAESRWRTLRAAAAVAVLIALARGCLFLRPYVGGMQEQLLNFIRIFIYIGLLATWIASVRQRVVQTQVRRYLIAAALFMLCWLTLRQFKWVFVHDPTAVRYLWYLYYIPLLLIPTTALFISLLLGRPEQYRLPRRAALLLVPTALLIALVLTNDLHRLVFRFPADAAVWSEREYSYGVGFFCIAAWAIGCSLTAFFVMVFRSRIPQSKKILWLPMLPFGIAVAYIVLYALNDRLIRALAGDLAVAGCLFFAAFFECCIQCGLIQSNTRYADLFRTFMGASAQIVDREGRVHYAAGSARPIPMKTIKAAMVQPQILEDGKRLRSMALGGGYAVWTEDISELLRLRETLEDRREELRERNALLEYEYRREQSHKIVEEQNRLYDLLQSKTQTQLDRIEQLTARLRKTENEAERRKMLSEIVVLGSYIKRRRDFALSLDATQTVPESTLTNALAESFRALRLLEIRGGFLVQTGQKDLPGSVAELVYDAFEDIMESVLDRAKYLNVRVCPVEGALRLSILTDCWDADERLARKYPSLRIFADEDGTAYLLPPEGGGEV